MASSSQRSTPVWVVAMMLLLLQTLVTGDDDAPFDGAPWAHMMRQGEGDAAFAARVASSSTKMDASAAAQLLADARALNTSLHAADGAARARWHALQERRRLRLADVERCAQARSHAGSSGSDDDGGTDCGEPAAPSGRGVLIAAGGAAGLLQAYMAVRALRRVGCRLPVEVVYYGRAEYDARAAALLEGLNHGNDGGGSDGDDDDDSSSSASQQTCSAAAGPDGGGGGDNGSSSSSGTGSSYGRVALIDGLAVPHAAHRIAPHRPVRPTGFAAKVHALAFATSFDQVLLLDADNAALADPEPLFESPQFKAAGSLFWADFWARQWVDRGAYDLVGMAPPWEAAAAGDGSGGSDSHRTAAAEARAAEAGQLLVDRAAHADALEFAWLLVAGSAGAARAVAACLWGDKDLYRVAFHLAGKPTAYAIVDALPREVLGKGAGGGSGGGSLHHLGMLQLAPGGRRAAFFHRTAAGKLLPHCAVRSRAAPAACLPAYFTASPPCERQLLAAVADPSEMVFPPPAVDAQWHESHGCGSGSVGVSGGGDGDDDHPATLPKCARWPRQSDGGDGGGEGDDDTRVPIALVPARLLPALADTAAWVHSALYLPLLEGRAPLAE